MNDPTPDNRNRLAYALGYLFHPFVIFFIGAYMVLRELPTAEALRWTLLTAALTIPPTFIMMRRVRWGGRYLYQRETRGPVYAVAWLSLVFCGAVLALLDAPLHLLACVVAGAVWVPIQALVNERYTKISGHAGFSMAVGVGLLLLGELDTPLLLIAALAVIVLTAWARYVTKHHTLEQILLGWLVGGGAVAASFAVIL